MPEDQGFKVHFLHLPLSSLSVNLDPFRAFPSLPRLSCQGYACFPPNLRVQDHLN